MSTLEDIEQRLRAARPEAEIPYPPVSAVLARIEQAAQDEGTAHDKRLAHETRRRPTLRRGGLALPAAIGVVVLAAASAGAALLLTPGEKVAPAFVVPATPNAGLGEPVTSTLTPLPMRVADPQGGPPWAMRVIRTTRGLLCLQGGRVVGGALGALGSGYAFNGDGRFHPLLPEDAISTDACPAAGSSAAAFLPAPPVIVPANGVSLAGENVAADDQNHCDLPGQANWGVRCPQSELRQVAMGLLGPDAKSILVSTPNGSFTTSPYGPDGAYLVVLPAQPNANAGMSSGAAQGPFGYASHAAGGATLTVTYVDGSHCQIPAGDAAQQCHDRGSADAGLPSASQLSAPVHARYLPEDEHAVAPLLTQGGAQGSSAAAPPQSGGVSAGPALTVGFEAPVDTHDASSAYVLELRPKAGAGCAAPAVIVSQPTSQTYAAGEQVQITVSLANKCATSYSGRVFFAKSTGVGGESGGNGPLYEAIANQFGPAGSGGNPMSFPTVGDFNIAVP
jgi:hypothetical protein